MKPALRFVVVATISLAAASAAAAQESWVGKTIITKKASIKFGRVGTNGKPVDFAVLKELLYKVLGDKDGWLQVNDHGDTGWLDKADAVLLEDAVAFFTERIRQNGEDADAYNRRAAAWQFKGEFDNAIKDYSEVLRVDPGAYSYTNRGLVWRDKKNYDKAIADYNEAIRLDPDFAGAYISRGNAWYDKNDYDKAIADYNEMIRRDPKVVVTYYNRGIAWYAKKDYDLAITDFNEAIRLNPKDVSAYYYRGLAFRANKNYDNAITDYNDVIRLDPKHVHAYNSRAWLWATCANAQFRDGKKAIESAKQAMDLDKANANWYANTLAAAYAESGDFAEAVRWQEKALEDSQLKNDKDARRRLEHYRDKKPYRQE